MYDFKDFVNNMKEELSSRIPDAELSIRDVVKNNDVIHTAITIKKDNEEAAPSIYMDYYYSRYKAGVDMNYLISDAMNEYNNSSRIGSNFNDEMFYARDNIFLKLVNKQRNTKNLEDTPYIEFKDLAVTFRVLIYKDANGIASVQVTNKVLEKMGLSKEEAFDIAKMNTLQLFSPEFQNISDVIRRDTNEEFDIPDMDIYMLTTDVGVNGATLLLYDELINDFVNKNGECYIITSSVHEVIFIPKDNVDDIRDFKELIREVNNIMTPKQDYLSDNIYLADGHGISIVGGMENEEYMDM